VRQLQRNIRTEKSGVFDAAGNLTVYIQIVPGPSWELRQVAVSTTVTANETECSTYIGFNNSGVFISQTLLGNSDTDSQPNVILRPGDAIAAVWSGGTVSATGKLTLIYDEIGV